MVARVPRWEKRCDIRPPTCSVEAESSTATAAAIRNVALGVPFLAGALRPPITSSLAIKTAVDAAVARPWRP